jgi:hypothetical protein
MGKNTSEVCKWVAATMGVVDVGGGGDADGSRKTLSGVGFRVASALVVEVIVSGGGSCNTLSGLGFNLTSSTRKGLKAFTSFSFLAIVFEGGPLQDYFKVA